MHHGGDVAGLPMAMTAPDRDGLELDSLGVSLGPVLPGWPTGLVVRADLQGDILTGVTATWVDVPEHQGAAGRPGGNRRQRALDQLGRFLVVAGWPVAARDARRARDGLASPDPVVAADAERTATRLARRVRRSGLLAWSVRGIGGTDPGPEDAVPASPTMDGDALDRVRRWCDLVDGRADHGALPELPVAALAPLLEGAELATARLAVASVALEPAQARRTHEVVHA